VFKLVHERVWAFDCEWVPDPVAGRLLYKVPDSVQDPRDVLEVMWREGGATPDDPTPFLKTVLCRVVAISAVERRVRAGGEVSLQLLSLPREVDDPEQTAEAAIVGAFLDAVGRNKPQLVGFNSAESDLRILVQRAVVLGLRSPDFARRPDKPWEGVDYFARYSDWNVDLKDVLGGWGKTVPSLHELATLSGIPGKMDVDGNQVAELWLRGELREIVDYNRFDALTTYLVWLRAAHFAGHLDAEGYRVEQERLRSLLEKLASTAEGAHLSRYLEEWDRLRAALQRAAQGPA